MWYAHSLLKMPCHIPSYVCFWPPSTCMSMSPSSGDGMKKSSSGICSILLILRIEEFKHDEFQTVLVKTFLSDWKFLFCCLVANKIFIWNPSWWKKLRNSHCPKIIECSIWTGLMNLWQNFIEAGVTNAAVCTSYTSANQMWRQQQVPIWSISLVTFGIMDNRTKTALGHPVLKSCTCPGHYTQLSSENKTNSMPKPSFESKHNCCVGDVIRTKLPQAPGNHTQTPLFGHMVRFAKMRTPIATFPTTTPILFTLTWLSLSSLLGKQITGHRLPWDILSWKFCTCPGCYTQLSSENKADSMPKPSLESKWNCWRCDKNVNYLKHQQTTPKHQSHTGQAFMVIW